MREKVGKREKKKRNRLGRREKLAQKSRGREKLAQKLGRREISPPVSPPPLKGEIRRDKFTLGQSPGQTKQL